MVAEEKRNEGFDVTILSAFYNELKNTDGQISSQQEWRIYIVNQPGATLLIESKEVKLSPKSYYLIPPGKTFSFTIEEAVHQLSISFETSLEYDFEETLYVKGPLETSESFVAMIKRELSRKQAISPKGLALSTALCGIILAELPFDGKPFNPMLENAMRFLEDNLTSPVNIKDLAEEHGYCQDAFIRKFKKYTGLTPYNFLYTARIKFTEQLLANKETPMDLIADKAGFHDQAHFSRLFKKYNGVTPTKFRQKLNRSL